ncbi:MAG: nicotinate-nucleotide adenylyltransferase [Prevotellaceae bacterium]|jgi:nicotinate-nucleotide adenylyltransferase|nr:nicotinate-nucleotide adenylyltransferase [Prevotellaceae bacterium]
MSKRIGIFGGSFSPIHIGHLALANYLCAYDYVDEMWFMVSPRNPLKDSEELWDDEFRLQLVRQATKEYARFHVCDVEFSLPRPSYTITTFDYLHKLYPDYTFVLIIGSDNWLQFNLWKEHERFIREYHILVYPRSGFPLTNKQKLPSSVQVVSAPLLNISSTFVRQALDEERDVRYFLHPSTVELLRERAKN